MTTTNAVQNVDPVLEEAIAETAISEPDKYFEMGLSVAHFETRIPRLIIRAVDALKSQNMAVERCTVMEQMRRHGAKLEDEMYVLDLELAQYRCKIDPGRLRDLKRLRELRERLSEAQLLIDRGELGPAMGALDEVRERAYTGTTVMNAGVLAETAIERFAAPVEQRISVGLPRLSSAIGYMPRGGLMVVAGDTGVGKSSFVLELLLAAAKSGCGAGMVSMEDSEEIAGGRLLSMESGVSARLLQRGIADNSGWDSVNQAYFSARALGDRFLFANCIGGSELDVCAAISQMARRGAKLVCVDYIQEVDSSERQQDRRNEIRWMLTRLKAHAMRLGIALVVVSQLKRLPEARRRPTKHDLKECGDLENKSEVVLLLWREEDTDFAPVHVEVAKCKWGGTGQTWDMRREMSANSARLLEVA